LQAHCQIPTSQRYNLSFVKEPASQPNEEKKSLKMPHRTKKDKMKDMETKILTDRIIKHETLTSGCCQWRGSASNDSYVHIETYVLCGKFSAKNRHRTATASRCQ